MSLLNFKLKHPATITPWGSVGWFVLSDGEYWLDLGKVKFYEFTDEALKEFGETSSKFVDYQIARLVDDFSILFEHISESLPEDFYEIASHEDSLFDFYSKAGKKVDELNDENISDEDFYSSHKVLEWISNRSLSAIHLSSAPAICFFRKRDKISLVWDAESTTENGRQIWVAGKGNIEIDYEQFVAEVESFKERLFEAMAEQIKIANSIDWGHFIVDKKRRLEEQVERKEKFEARMKFLSSIENNVVTDWEEIRQVRRELNI